jgi:multisubunit Na+/H+ antiporter MnhE subunit
MIAAKGQWSRVAQIVVIPIMVLIVSFDIAGLVPGVVIGAIISIAFVLFVTRRRGKKSLSGPR